MLYYLTIAREFITSKCSDKYKKLQIELEEEKQKYQDLKAWAERLILSNQELLEQVKKIKNK
tara:strand:- start:1467 stop:1652 length:186 start_codon:yes stop_codon:yes gene_type:complete